MAACFDNVDGIETFHVSSFCPNTSKGTIIITSRRPECIRYGQPLLLSGLEEGESIKLLSKTSFLEINAKDVAEYEEAKAIVRELGYLPLAIDQAGAYLHASQKPLNSYLSRFNENFKLLLNKKTPDALWQYRNDTVFTTWEVSFRQFKHEMRKLRDFY